MPETPSQPSGCDPWTFHTVEFDLRGRCSADLLRQIRSSPLRPTLVPRWFPVAGTKRRAIGGWRIGTNLSHPETTALLSLQEIALLLGNCLAESLWLLHPCLRVSRTDLASDHIVAAPPGRICDAIGRLNLPYSQRAIGYSEDGDPWRTAYHVSGRVNTEPILFAKHHRKGRQPMVVAHYPRLDKLREDRPLHAAPEAAAAYTAGRVRQEVRFRPEAIRRVIGGGPATPGMVLASLGELVRAAERRLRPIAKEGILPFPATGPDGMAALEEVAGVLG